LDVDSTLHSPTLANVPYCRDFRTGRQYWSPCGKAYVERLRKQSGDIAYFNDFEIFVEKMEKEELKRGAHTPGAESIRAFLDSEASLPQLLS